MKLSNEKILSMYENMLKIRKFEERAMILFSEGQIPGFVHLYIGEEAVATGACANLNEDDFITSTHRGHGHIVSKGGDLNLMMAELFGKETGYCKGKGGSMHIADATKGILGANGIVGAGHNIAAGAGLSAKYRGTEQVCVCFFGDASTNQSTFHESMNLSSIWKLPVVYVCENNGYGISMSQERQMAVKNISDRATAYNIPGVTVDGNDVFAVYEAVEEAVKRARKQQGPTLVECKTYRHRGHFEGDPTIYRAASELQEWLEKDPVKRMESFLVENKVATLEEIEALINKIETEVSNAVKFAQDSPYPAVEQAVQDIFSDIVEEVKIR